MAEIDSAARTLRKAGSNEKKDISKIIEGINAGNALGDRIIKAFAIKFPGYTLVRARERTGSDRTTHYDFEVCVRSTTGEEWKRVEHKGSQIKTPINPADTPWQSSVQFHNGGSEKYSHTKRYARVWYDMYIKSGVLTREFGLTAPIPEFETWFAKDCKAQTEPKSPYGKELKNNVKAARGGKSLLGEREDVNKAITFSEEEKETLKREVLKYAQEVFRDKEYWLTLHGSLDGEFHVAWYPQLTLASIKSVTIDTSSLDVWAHFTCSDDYPYGLAAHLRWGYGAGFSNLRCDLKSPLKVHSMSSSSSASSAPAAASSSR